MRAGSLKENCFIVDLINQDPIGLDMKVAAGLPLALQKVVAEFRRQGLGRYQQSNDSAQLFHIFATLFGQFHVPLELAGVAWRTHQRRNWGQIPIKEKISIWPLKYMQSKLFFKSCVEHWTVSTVQLCRYGRQPFV